MQYIWR